MLIVLVVITVSALITTKERTATKVGQSAGLLVTVVFHIRPDNPLSTLGFPAEEMRGGVGWRGGGGGGYPTEFYSGRLLSDLQTLTLWNTIFDRKGSPFIFLPLKMETLSYSNRR